MRSLLARSRARAANAAEAVAQGPQDPKGEVAPFPGPADPLVGLLDERCERAWEATLKKTELERWEELKQAIADASPDMRWRAAGYAIRMELEYARRQLRIARNIANEPYKADLIARNGVDLRKAVERLEDRLGGLYDYVRPMDVILTGVEQAWQAVEHCQRTLGRVVSPWRDTARGAEKGIGIPGYDTPEGVERARQQIRDAYERDKDRIQAARREREPEVKAIPMPRRRRGTVNPNQPALLGTAKPDS